jgi:hypothetical protein
VTLADVCFKPFGGACATQSVLQYWHMDRAFYEAEQAKGPFSAARLTPDYCFGHWCAGVGRDRGASLGEGQQVRSLPRPCGRKAQCA